MLLGGGFGGDDPFEGIDVVEVVAGGDFYEGPEGDGPEFGVEGGAVFVGFGEAVDEGEIPAAERDPGGAGGLGGVFNALVGAGPGVLLEGLEGGVVGAVDVAEAPGPGHLAVGEVGEDLADRPLGGGGFVFDLLGGESGEDLDEARRRGAQYLGGVAALEEMDVGPGFLFAHAGLDAGWVAVAASSAFQGSYSPTDQWKPSGSRIQKAWPP